MPRQSLFSQDLADTICERLSEGLSLRKVCAAAGMPDIRTVLRWLGQNAEFRAQYEEARQAQQAHIFEELREIADSAERDWITREDGRREFDHEHVHRSR